MTVEVFPLGVGHWKTWEIFTKKQPTKTVKFLSTPPPIPQLGKNMFLDGKKHNWLIQFWILGRHFVSELSQLFSWRGDFFFGRKPGKNVQFSVPVPSMDILYICLYAKNLIIKNGGNLRNISLRSFLLNDRKNSKSSPLVVHKQSWT